MRRRILGELSGRPQEFTLATHALDEIERRLGELARLGFPMHLAEGPAPPEAEFPKRMFHVGTPRGRLVHSRWELEDLGPDWHETLEQALHLEGVVTQFASRGGVQRRGALAMLAGPGRPTEAERREAAKAEIDRRVAEWKALRAAE